MSFGFVIVRHVNNNITNEYWKQSYLSIRKFYDNPVLIIDDNSDSNFLKSDISLVNCIIINSEFPKGVGELLGYYYFHKTHFVEKAVIIHDSVFINSKIDFDKYGEAKTLWSFKHYWDEDRPTIQLMGYLKDSSDLIRLYLNKNNWPGSFGVMNVITWRMLDKINNRHELFDSLIPRINSRTIRTYVERIFACLCQLNYPDYNNPPHVINDIHEHGWGLTYEQYKKQNNSHLPIIKVWTGR